MSDLKALLDFVAGLRAEDTGCRWTRKQTMTSLSSQTLDECYELLEAIASHDPVDIKEELGDLLYHVVFYIQLAHEKAWFNEQEVIETVLKKHQQRMPPKHLRSALNAEQTNAYWQAQKKKEKPEKKIKISYVHLPAMLYAWKLQEKAMDDGFIWQHWCFAWGKVHEELNELKACLETSEDEHRMAEEYGDLLFSCVNLGHYLNIDPEYALRQASQKFSRRFLALEKIIDNQKLCLKQLTQDELLKLCNLAKEDEKNTSDC